MTIDYDRLQLILEAQKSRDLVARALEEERKRREQAAIEAEAQRLQELEEKRQARELQEAYAAMTPEQRAVFEYQAAPHEVVKRLAEKANAKSDEEFARQNQAIIDAEFAEWRGKNPRANQWEIFNVREDIKARAAARSAEWQGARKRLELEAEAHDDPVQRHFATLDPRGRQVFSRLLKEEPGLQQQAERVKQTPTTAATPTATTTTPAQSDDQALQKSLRDGYLAELVQARTPAHKHNVLMKWRAKGMKG
jgi:hypothetical protein